MTEASYEIRAITANRLIDGEVVYRGTDGWKTDLVEATLCHSKEATAAVLSQAQADEKACLIVSSYPIKLRQEGGDLIPVLWREVIRSRGPTVPLIDGVIAHADGHKGFGTEGTSPWPTRPSDSPSSPSSSSPAKSSTSPHPSPPNTPTRRR